MTVNPNSRITELKTPRRHDAERRPGAAEAIGSLFAGAFIVVISFIARRFYQ